MLEVRPGRLRWHPHQRAPGVPSSPRCFFCGVTLYSAVSERRGAEEVRAGVPVPSEEGGAEVPGPEGACGGEAGQVTARAAPAPAGDSDAPPWAWGRGAFFQHNSVWP